MHLLALPALMTTSMLLILSLFLHPAPAVSMSVNPDISRVLLVDGSIDANKFDFHKKRLAELSKSPTGPGSVDIIINSPGGRVTEGFSFVIAMRSFQASGGKIRCMVVEEASSMAFHILTHCNERHALAESMLLWHPARVMVGGLFGAPMTYDNAYSLAQQLKQIDDHIFGDLMEAMGKRHEEYIRYHFSKETMHLGSILAKKLPGFITSHAAIGNLLETMEELRRIEAEKQKEQPLLKLPFGNDRSPTFIYQREGTY